MSSYTGALELTKLNNTVETEEEIGGVMEKGIFIPYRYNSFYKTKKGHKALKITVLEKSANFKGQSHMVMQRCDKKMYKELKELGCDFYIFGNLYLLDTYSGMAKQEHVKNKIDEIFKK